VLTQRVVIEEIPSMFDWYQVVDLTTGEEVQA